MRVLVTGGTGFFGRHIVEALRAKHRPMPIGSKQDLADPGIAGSVMRCFRPDVVIHAAGVCGGIGANVKSPLHFLASNAAMGINVISACASYGIKRLVLIGTICSYPENAPVPFVESDLWNGYPEPTNAPYGVAKRLVMEAGKALARQSFTSVAAILPANLYGPGDCFGDGAHVVPDLIERLSSGDGQLWGDGTPTRDFLYVEDAARGVAAAVDQWTSGYSEINLGTGRETSIAEAAEIVARHVGYSGPITWDPNKPNGQKRRCVDSSRALSLLGWRAETELEEGIARTVAWYRARS